MPTPRNERFPRPHAFTPTTPFSAPLALGGSGLPIPMAPPDSSVRILAPRQWWYVAPSASSPSGTSAEGPMPMSRLQSAIQQGTIESTRLVWSPGMVGWEPAGHQEEFSFEFSPPPLPAA